MSFVSSSVFIANFEQVFGGRIKFTCKAFKSDFFWVCVFKVYARVSIEKIKKTAIFPSTQPMVLAFYIGALV